YPLANGLRTVLAERLGSITPEHPKAESHVSNQGLVPDTERACDGEDLLGCRVRGLPSPTHERAPNAERWHQKEPRERVNQELVRIERRALSICVDADHLVDG